METLKKFFPLSFKHTESIGSLIVGIIIYLVIGAIAGLLIAFAGAIGGWIPVVGAILGWVLRIVSIIVELYVLIGIVFLVLAFLKIVK